MRQFLTSTPKRHRGFRLRGAVFVSIMLLTAAISCNKSPQNAVARPSYPGIQASQLDSVKHFLQDSLPASAYDSLQFSQGVLDTAASGNLYLRFPSLGDPISKRFLLVETSPGFIPLKAVGIRIIQTGQDTASTRSSGSFNGTIVKTWLKGSVAYTSPVVSGFATVLHPAKTVSTDAADKSNDSDFDGTGETLPDILIEAPFEDDENMMFYADLGVFIEGGGGSGSYQLLSGGGSSSSSSVSVYAVDVQAEKPGINVKAYLACLDAFTGKDPTYSVTIYSAIPSSNPNIMFNPSTLHVGHTFLGLTKTAGGQSATQYIGFYASCGWCAVTGNFTTSKLVDNEGHPYNASYTVNVTADQFAAVQTRMESDADLDYSLYDYNCASYALDVFDLVAPGVLEVPDMSLTPIAPPGITPNGVYIAIAKLVWDGVDGATASPVQSAAGQSYGNCGGTISVGTQSGLTP
ncbi:MAG: hypothetical protein P4L51_06090 [Puia sp.]|nr:hypothetical protein [Puia sp.]